MSVEILSRLTAAFGMRKWLRHRGAPMTTNSFAAVFGAWLSLGLGMSSFDAVDGSSTGT
jgi:hypothetical protein